MSLAAHTLGKQLSGREQRISMHSTSHTLRNAYGAAQVTCVKDGQRIFGVTNPVFLDKRLNKCSEAHAGTLCTFVLVRRVVINMWIAEDRGSPRTGGVTSLSL
jgi:hypothetical protein